MKFSKRVMFSFVDWELYRLVNQKKGEKTRKKTRLVKKLPEKKEAKFLNDIFGVLLKRMGIFLHLFF